MNNRTHTNPEIIFLRVTDANTKLGRIVNTIQQHFFSGDSLIIFVPSEQAASYIDALLWKIPPESFLPHAIAHENSTEKIVITEKTINLNNATIALNLRSDICNIHECFDKIYELWDESDNQKRVQSVQKMEHYQRLGLC